jgi:hypothetical protein
MGANMSWAPPPGDSSREPPGETLRREAGSSHFMRRVTIPWEEPELVVKDVIHSGIPVVMIWNLGHDISSFEPLVQENLLGRQSYEWSLETNKKQKFLMSIEVGGKFDKIRSSIETIKGNKNPMLGWYAPDYHTKVAVPVIKLSLEIPEGAIVITRLIKL